MRLKTEHAFRLKEALRAIFAEADSRPEADTMLSAWTRWTRRSRFAPFKNLALTLKAHWAGILNSFDSGLRNGPVEALKGLIQAAKARSGGYRTARNLINVSYLIAGKLIHLPASHYATTSGVALD